MTVKGAQSICPRCGFREGTPPASHLHLPPGTRLCGGKYMLGKVLGHGGFGITYIGWDNNLNIRLAIKEYFPAQDATRDAQGNVVAFSGESRARFDAGLARFLEEARILARFQQHPAIIGAHDFFRENGSAYLVMNFYEGVSLRRYLDQHKGRLDSQQAIGVVLPILGALSALHDQGYLHRDISPDNIYITQNAQPKLLDFGAARYASGDEKRSLSVLLKPGYSPEEQYRTHGNQGPWTDLYALGATLYRMITGQIPPEALERVRQDTMKRPSDWGIVVPPAIEEVILKALAPLPADRYRSADAMHQALERALPTGKAPHLIPPEQELAPVASDPLVDTLSRTRAHSQPAAAPQKAPDAKKSAAPKQGGKSLSREFWVGAAGTVLLIILIGGGIAIVRNLPSMQNTPPPVVQPSPDQTTIAPETTPANITPTPAPSATGEDSSQTPAPETTPPPDVTVSTQPPITGITPTPEPTLTAEPTIAPQHGPALSPFVQDGRYGFTDAQGRIALLAAYDEALPFADGLAPVRAGNFWGAIDTNGNWVIDARYDEPFRFENGFARASRAGQWTLIKADGTQLLNEYFDEISAPISDMWAVRRGEQWGILKTDASYALEIAHEKAIMIGRRQYASLDEGIVTFYNASGRPRGQISAQDMLPLGENIIGVYMQGKWDIMEVQTLQITQLRCDELGAFSGDYIAYCVAGRWGVVSKDGRTVIAPQYSAIPQIVGDGFVVEKSGLYGVIGADGLPRMAFSYNALTAYGADLYYFSTDLFWGYMDGAENILWYVFH